MQQTQLTKKNKYYFNSKEICAFKKYYTNMSYIDTQSDTN